MASGNENQDAWGTWSGLVGAVIVVADGVGSVSRAREGARRAVEAGIRGGRAWLTGAAASDEVPGVVTRAWVEGIDGDLCAHATTCSIAAAACDGRVLVASLGDALACLLLRGEMQVAHERLAFNNETHALSSASVHPRWVTAEHDGFGPSDGVLLATDGVADDLLTDRLQSAFARGRALVDERGTAGARAALKAELHDWHTPGHLDDKTVALLLGAAA